MLVFPCGGSNYVIRVVYISILFVVPRYGNDVSVVKLEIKNVFLWVGQALNFDYPSKATIVANIKVRVNMY